MIEFARFLHYWNIYMRDMRYVLIWEKNEQTDDTC